MSRRLIGLVLFACVGAGLAAWWIARVPASPPQGQVPRAAPRVAADMAVAPMPAATPRERARFDPAAFEADKKAQLEAVFAQLDAQPPFPQRVDAALRSAEAGDVEAAATLGGLLGQCTDVLRDPQGRKIEADWQYELAQVEDLRGSDPESAENALFNRRQEHERSLAHHAECIAVGLTLVADYHVWLERAARGGSVMAMREYANRAFDGFTDQDAMLADLDEVLRRRDLARTFLRQALAHGDVPSIQLLASSHDWEPWSGQRVYTDTGGLFPPDRLQAQTYWYLNALARSAYYGQGEPFERLWTNGPQRHEHAGLDEIQWQAVANAARDLYLRHFTDPPPPPG